MFNKYSGNQDYWKDKKINNVPNCAKGQMYGDTYIDDKIGHLQSGKIKFQFLEYIATNSGIGLHELENLSYYTYRTFEEGAMAILAVVTPMTLIGVGFEEKESSSATAQGGPAEEVTKLDIEGTSKDDEVMTEDVTGDDNVEDPGDVGVA